MIDVMLVLARTLVLLMCGFGAIYSIKVGASLYERALSDKSSIELSDYGAKLILKAAGPGLMLMLFGIVVLVVLANKTLVIETTGVPNTSPTAWRHTPSSGLLFVDEKENPATQSCTSNCPKCLVQTSRRLGTGVDISNASIALAIERALSALKGKSLTDVERAESVSTLSTLETLLQ